MSDALVPIKILPVDTTEEMILNTDFPFCKDWRYYRIEYGGPNEDCLWEGRILLPANADPDLLIQLLMGMQAYWQLWRKVE